MAVRSASGPSVRPRARRTERAGGDVTSAAHRVSAQCARRLVCKPDYTYSHDFLKLTVVSRIKPILELQKSSQAQANPPGGGLSNPSPPCAWVNTRNLRAPSVRILITGASGFIGRHLSAYAVSRGHTVTGTYLSESELSARDLPNKGIQWVRLDMRAPAKVKPLVAECHPDAVFHLAAQAYAKKAWNKPFDTFRTNVLGTIALYEALRRYPPRKGTLLTASASAYGEVKALPIREETPLNPTNPYGVSKACQEMLSLQYSLNYGLRIVRARLFGTTGPGKTGDALNDFARQIAAIERTRTPGILRVGNLSTRRDVQDIRDAVRALWLVFEKGIPSQPVNIGSGKSCSIRWIAETLARLSRVAVKIRVEKALFRPTDEAGNEAEISRLLALGYHPDFPIERTISDSLDYWRQG